MGTVKVQIETGAYGGTWCVYPVTSHLVGKQPVELETGLEYRLCIADDWYGGIRFSVDPDEGIQPLDPDLIGEKIDMEALTQRTFRFQCCTVHVDDGGRSGFVGIFGFGRAGATRRHQRDITLVKDSTYHVAAGVYNTSLVRVDGEGQFEPFEPLVPYHQHAFDIRGDTLVLHPVGIALRTNGYLGKWTLVKVQSGTGEPAPAEPVRLIPTFTYRLSLGQGTWPLDAFSFYVDSCGNVAPHHSDGDAWYSTAFSDAELALRTVICKVEVEGQPRWRIHHIPETQDKHVTLVRNIQYAIEVLHGRGRDATWRQGRFRVTRHGEVEPGDFVVGQHRVTIEREGASPHAREPYPALGLEGRPSSPLDDLD